MPETITLDPSEVAADRTELDITPWVKAEGINWGDAEIEMYMAEQSRGQIPVDYRLPNRKIEIPLVLREAGTVSFDQARSKIQSKAALLQQEGGWLQRITSAGGTVYADITSTTLKYGGGWGQAHRDYDENAVLTLEAIPDWYGDEVTLADHTETTLPELVFTETDSDGDYPGRLRIVVDEDSGNSQLGLIGGIRCKNYDAAATARLAYEAEAMTALDTAAIATISGASGGGSNNVVRHTNLATSWTPVLSTQAVSAGAHKTHKGTYRPWVRVYSTSGDDVQLRLVWDVGDLALPVENAPVRLPPTGSQFYLVDLGEIRLDPSPTGDHRWQGVIQAKGDAGAENVSIDRVYFVPVDEGYWVLRSPATADPTQVTYSARDEFNQTAGALTGKTLPVGGTWVGAGDADDFSVETSGKTAQRTALSDTTLRFALAGTATPTAIVEQVDFKLNTLSGLVDYPAAGLFARYADTSNYIYAHWEGHADDQALGIAKKVGGALTVIASESAGFGAGEVKADTWYSLRLLVDTAGRVFLWLWAAGATPGVPRIVAQDSALATGGALASGRFGFFDNYTGSVALTRNYDNFAAWVPTPDAVLFANQSAELRSDGMFREDSAGAAYGPVSQVIGDLPRLPPAGLEDRTVEMFLKASRGDLDQLPDSGVDDISARLYSRSSHLFVPSS